MQDEAKVRNLSPKTQAMDPSESNKRRILSLFKKKFSTEECLHSFSDAMRQEQEKIISSLMFILNGPRNFVFSFIIYTD